MQFRFRTEAVLAIRPGRPWPTQTRSWPTQTARVIPMIPTYTTSVGLPNICLAFDWPTQMKIPRTASDSESTRHETLEKVDGVVDVLCEVYGFVPCCEDIVLRMQ